MVIGPMVIGSVRALRGDDGQPAVLTDGDVVLDHEAEDVGVEPQRLLLVDRGVVRVGA